MQIEATRAQAQEILRDASVDDGNPFDENRLRALALVLLRAGEPARAVELAQRLEVLRPKEADTWWVMGKCFLLNHEYERAEQAFREAHWLQPDNAAPLGGLALVFAVRVDAPAAWREAQRALALDRKDPEARIVQAICAPGVAGKDRAKWLRRAIKDLPEYAPLLAFELASATCALGDWPQAEADLRAALAWPTPVHGRRSYTLYVLARVLTEQGRIAEALEQATESMRLAWGEADPRRLRIELLRKMGRAAQADEEKRYLNAIDPNPQAAEAAREADRVRHAHAMALMFNGDTAESGPAWVRALLHDTDDVMAYAGLAHALIDRDRLDEAQAAIDAALLRNPRHANAWHHQGIVYWQKRQFHQAADAFAYAAELDPNPGTHCLLADARMHLDRSDAIARRLLDELVEAGHTNFMVWRLLAESAAAHDNQAEAADYARRALAERPDLFHVQLTGAKILGGEEGELCARRAVELCPADTANRRLLLGCLLEYGLRPEIEALVEAILQAEPRDALALRVRGQLFRERGMSSEAVAQLEAAVAADPTALVSWLALEQAYLAVGEDKKYFLSVVKRVALYPAAPAFAEAAANLTEAGFLDAAAWLLEQSAAHFPDAPSLSMIRGSHLLAQKKFAEALPLLERGFRHLPSTRLLWDLMNCLVMLGRAGEAADTAQQWYAAEPHDPERAEAYAWACWRAKRYAEGILASEALCAGSPENVNAAQVLAELYAEAGRFEDAVSARRQLLKRFPSAENAFRLGNLLVRLQRFPDAVEAFYEAGHLEPQRLEPCVSRANALLRLGLLDDGLAVLDEIRKTYPQHADSIANLRKTWTSEPIPPTAPAAELVLVLHEAIRYRDARLVASLTTRLPVTTLRRDASILASFAGFAGDVDIARFLLNRRDVFEPSDWSSMLRPAALHGHEALVALLLEAGAERYTERTLRQALEGAESGGHTAVATRLRAALG